ncbi:MAG: serine/threonine protein kinase [Deltaproteobacteria bacterium]|nr:serine/threonine protein kinase [Deltaproteobacteria bacterium]
MRIGHYDIIDKLGEGGTAIVYRARDSRDPRAPVVVLKQLTEAAASDPDFVDRFMAEIDLCRRFDHPNVIKTLDFGSTENSYFVALYYVDGQNLDAVLSRARKKEIRFPIPFVLFIIDEALKGLGYAHTAKSATGEALGLVHRDVSPHNLFIAYDGRTLLGDFGVALLPGLDDTALQRLTMGKLGYLSPEQCFGEPVDQRSDLFSMTIVMAEALTGRRLFAPQGQESDQDVMRRIGEGARPDFRALNPDIPPGIAWVLNTGLAHAAHKRFANAQAMRAAIAPFLQPEVGNPLAIAAMLRHMFKEEFEGSRLSGSPLTF